MCATVMKLSWNRHTTSVVPIPAHSGLFCEVVKIAAFARPICSRSIRSETAFASSRPMRATSAGSQVSCSPSEMSEVAMPLATSPALYPPMPSAST